MWEVGVYIGINQDLKNREKKRNLGIKILPSEYRIIHMNEAVPGGFGEHGNWAFISGEHGNCYVKFLLFFRGFFRPICLYLG